MDTKIPKTIAIQKSCCNFAELYSKKARKMRHTLMLATVDEYVSFFYLGPGDVAYF